MIGYAISTNVEYLDVTVPRLIQSLYRAGIAPDEIAVFVGRASAYETVEHEDGYNEYYFPWGAWEYTALIGATMVELPYSHIFLLHDTCEVGEAFRRKIVWNTNKDADITTTNNALCNFGAYRVDFLKSVSRYLNDLINCDKYTAIQHEGLLYRRRMGVTDEYPCYGAECEIIGERDVYGQGVPRIIEYYPAIDLYKYKANFGNDE